MAKKMSELEIEEYVDRSETIWATLTEFPDYEINGLAVIRNKRTKTPIKIYGGLDYEYVESVYLWRAGVRECRAVSALFRTALAMSAITREDRQ